MQLEFIRGSSLGVGAGRVVCMESTAVPVGVPAAMAQAEVWTR